MRCRVTDKKRAGQIIWLEYEWKVRMRGEQGVLVVLKSRLDSVIGALHYVINLVSIHRYRTDSKIQGKFNSVNFNA